MSFDVLFEFESAIAEYTGAPYAVVTDCCTHAMHLCLIYDQVQSVEFPAYTYLSLPQLMNQLNIRYSYKDVDWQDAGEYQFAGTRIWDSARLFGRNMYRSGQLQCLSFGNGKPLHLGRVGAILTDDADAYRELSCMRSDGRDLRIHPWSQQQTFKQGFHYCPTLESCAQGLEKIKSVTVPVTKINYIDLRTLTI
jgi:dTDP-4-amino-4,6-dideoxygalactose transaminase